MIVRFGIALVREHYDDSREGIFDQIDWFIMFILGASNLLDLSLRHHMRKIAQHYFSQHSPDRLESFEGFK